MKKCAYVIIEGKPYIFRLKQASKLYAKFCRGKLQDHKLVTGGNVITASDIEWLLRQEIERTDKKGRKIGKAIIERG